MALENKQNSAFSGGHDEATALLHRLLGDLTLALRVQVKAAIRRLTEADLRHLTSRASTGSILHENLKIHLARW